MKILSFLIFSISTLALAEGQKHQVSERQLDMLMQFAQGLSEKSKEISKEFGTSEVMPRERDRKDFQKEMFDLSRRNSEALNRWIERVKSGDPGPFPPPLGPAPTDITLTETFIETTGYSTSSPVDFQAASARATALCSSWKNAVSASTSGSVLFGQCGSAAQVAASDGKIGASVKGEIKLGFAKYTGHVPPLRLGTSFQLSTGYSTHSEVDYQAVAKSVLAHCSQWASQVRTLSKGVILAISCGAPSISNGFDGKRWVGVKGEVSYTYPAPLREVQSLNQQFVNTTGYSTYSPTDVAQATKTSSQQCNAWAADVLGNSAAIPLIVSCSGPEVIKNTKIDVRYVGQISLLPQ